MDMDPKSRHFIDMVVRGRYTGKPGVADPLPKEHGGQRLVVSGQRTPVPRTTRTRRTDQLPDLSALRVDRWTPGVLFQAGGWWIGVHYSKDEKRFCINFLPCLTIYLVKPGGNLPKRTLKR